MAKPDPVVVPIRLDLEPLAATMHVLADMLEELARGCRTAAEGLEEGGRAVTDEIRESAGE